MMINRYGNPNAQETDSMVALVQDVIRKTRVQPRPYQQRIVGKTHEMFGGTYKNGAGETEQQARSILIESPTGSGKTVMGWLAAKTLQTHLEAQGEDLVVGWVAMRRNLLAQAAKENGAYCPKLNPDGKSIGVRNAHLISMFDKNPEELYAARRAGKKILMVVDEAQHDAASSMCHLHNEILPDYILGLSATPFRTDRVKLCFDKVIKDAGIHQLVQDGYLSQFDHYTVDDWNVRTVVDTYLSDPKRWGKSAMYFVSLGQCHEAAAMLRAAGVVCDVVTGDSDCESQLEAFRNGDIPVLVNCMRLTEGWDEPSLQTVFIRDSGKGCTMQIAGRVFRKFEGLRKQVVQSKQSRWPIIRTAMPVQQYVWQEGGWLSLTVNPQLNQINQNARMAIASVQVDLPDFLTKRKKGRPARLRF